MVRTTQKQIPLDPAGKKIRHPEPRTAACVEILNLLPGRLRQVYCEKACSQELDQEALNSTRNSLLVSEGDYAQLLQNIYDTEIVKLWARRRKKSADYSESRKTEAKSND